jgi:hypothetical protein
MTKSPAGYGKKPGEANVNLGLTTKEQSIEEKIFCRTLFLGCFVVQILPCSRRRPHCLEFRVYAADGTYAAEAA